MRQLRGGGRGSLGFVGALLLASCGGGSQSGTGGNGGGGGGGAGGGGGSAGSGDGGVNCSAVTTACGGDVVGTWKVVQTCLSATVNLASVCPGASAVYDYTVTGTVTYNADLTYSSSGTVGALVHEQYPNGCMPFGYTCAQLDSIGMDAGTGSCVADTQGTCNCEGVVAPASSGETGTYKASGGTLTSMYSGNTRLASYCVQGSLLYESFEEQPDGGTTTAVGIYVWAKQ